MLVLTIADSEVAGKLFGSKVELDTYASFSMFAWTWPTGLRKLTNPPNDLDSTPRPVLDVRPIGKPSPLNVDCESTASAPLAKNEPSSLSLAEHASAKTNGDTDTEGDAEDVRDTETDGEPDTDSDWVELGDPELLALEVRETD